MCLVLCRLEGVLYNFEVEMIRIDMGIPGSMTREEALRRKKLPPRRCVILISCDSERFFLILTKRCTRSVPNLLTFSRSAWISLSTSVSRPANWDRRSRIGISFLKNTARPRRAWRSNTGLTRLILCTMSTISRSTNIYILIRRCGR